MTNRIMIAVALSGLGAGTASAEKIMQIDMNDMSFQSLDEAGAPAPFGGESHTGAVEITFNAQSQIKAVLIKDQPFGPFVPQDDFNGILTDITYTISLDAGLVTGGSFAVDVDGGEGGGGDTYEGLIGASGHVDGTQTGFSIDGISLSGAFSDPDFGGVDATDWFAAQGVGDNLEGSFLAFKINPDEAGAGISDVDAFVVVPAPAGAIVLLAGLVGARRRR